MIGVFYLAVQTKLLPARGSKRRWILAKAPVGEKKYVWKAALNEHENHYRAARAFFDSLGWYGTLHGGRLGDGTYVFVLDNYEPED